MLIFPKLSLWVVCKCHGYPFDVSTAKESHNAWPPACFRKRAWSKSLRGGSEAKKSTKSDLSVSEVWWKCVKGGKVTYFDLSKSGLRRKSVKWEKRRVSVIEGKKMTKSDQRQKERGRGPSLLEVDQRQKNDYVWSFPRQKYSESVWKEEKWLTLVVCKLEFCWKCVKEDKMTKSEGRQKNH